MAKQTKDEQIKGFKLDIKALKSECKILKANADLLEEKNEEAKSFNSELMEKLLEGTKLLEKSINDIDEANDLIRSSTKHVEILEQERKEWTAMFKREYLERINADIALDEIAEMNKLPSVEEMDKLVGTLLDSLKK